MPKPPCARAALLAAFLGLNASASLIGGEWLQLNFTDGYNPAAKDNFNYYISHNNGLNSTTGDSTSMIDAAGNVIAGLSLTAAGWEGRNFHSGTWVSNGQPTDAAADGSGSSTWSTDEYRNFWWDNAGPEPTVTITGLNPALTYDVYYYSKLITTAGTGEAHNLTINGVTQTTAVRGDRWADPDADLVFTALSPAGAGSNELQFTWSAFPSGGGRNPFVSAILIHAVPEPSPLALLSLGTLLLRARRRIFR